jgi:microcystin-dependent protein
MSYVTPSELAIGATVKASAWNILVNDLIDLNTKLTILEGEIPETPDFSSFPVGGVIPYSKPVATIPAGWYVCDGGTYEGEVVPDLRGKFILSLAVGEDDDELLDEGGSETHLHTNPNTGAGGSHNHAASGTTGNSTASTVVAAGSGGSVGAATHYHNVSFSTGSGGSHTHSVGDSGSANHLPPYTKMYYIIRLS